MAKPMEDIISEYADAVIDGQEPTVEEFLVGYSDLTGDEVAALRTALNGFVALRRLVEAEERLSVEEKRERGWQRFQAQMKAESAAPMASATTSAPSVGVLLGQAWEQQPAAVSEFQIPAVVIMDMVEDTSPIDLVAETADTRLRFAQRYAAGDQQLLAHIIKLVNRLRSFWLSQGQGTPGPVYGRPAPLSPDSQLDDFGEPR